MKTGSLLLACLIPFAPVFSQEAGLADYHERLLANPANETLYQRFIDGWLDTGSREDLEKKLSDEAPGSVEATLLWAKYLAREGRDEEGLLCLDRKIAEAPDPRLSLARARVRAGMLDLEGALEDLEKAGELSPEIRLEKAGWLARAGEMERARAEWTALLDERPDDEELREDLIALLRGEGQREEASVLLENLIATTRDPYQKALRMLELADLRQEAGEAIPAALFTEIIAMSGADGWLEGEALARAEKAFYQRNDLKGLREFYSGLRQEFPHRVSLRKGLARQMVELGETREGFELFREVLRVTPGDTGNREEFIALLEREARFAEAADELALLLADQATTARWWHMATLREKAGDREAMAAALEEALALAPPGGEWLRAVAEFGKRGLAEREEELLREKSASEPQAKEALAVLLAETDEATKREEAGRLMVELADGADADGAARVAGLLLRYRYAAEAVGLLEKSLASYPGHQNLGEYFCQALLASGEAERAWRQALALMAAAKGQQVPIALARAERVGRTCEGAEKLRIKLEKTPREWALLACLTSGDERREALAAAGRDEPELIVPLEVRFLREDGRYLQAGEFLLEQGNGSRLASLREAVPLFVAGRDFAKARECVDEWKILSPGDRAAWLASVRLHEQEGEFAEALAELRRALGRLGEDRELRERMAEIHLRLNEPDEADRIYRRLYDVAANASERTMVLNKRIELEERLRRTGLRDEYEERRRNRPRSVEPLLALVRIHAHFGNDGERLELLNDAARLEPRNPDILRSRADLAESLGEYEEAESGYRQLADATGDSQELAEYFLREGDLPRWIGLSRSAALAEPAKMEEFALSLLKLGEWEEARKSLLMMAERDWRLEYLLALAHLAGGEFDKARAVFLSLTSASGSLPGRKTVSQVQHRTPGASFKRAYPLFQSPEIVFWSMKSAIEREELLGGMFPNWPGLPDTPERCRDLALFHLHERAMTLEEEACDEALREIPFPDDLFWQPLGRGQSFTGWLRGELAAERLEAVKVLEEVPWQMVSFVDDNESSSLRNDVRRMALEKSDDPVLKIRLHFDLAPARGVGEQRLKEIMALWPQLPNQEKRPFYYASFLRWFTSDGSRLGEEFESFFLTICENEATMNSPLRYDLLTADESLYSRLAELDDARFLRWVNLIAREESAFLANNRSVRISAADTEWIWNAAGVPSKLMEFFPPRAALQVDESLEAFQVARLGDSDKRDEEAGPDRFERRVGKIVDHLDNTAFRALVRLDQGDRESLEKEAELLASEDQVPRKILAARLDRNYLGERERGLAILLEIGEGNLSSRDRVVFDKALIDECGNFTEEERAEIKEILVAAFRRLATKYGARDELVNASRDLGEEAFLERVTLQRANAMTASAAPQVRVSDFGDRLQNLLNAGQTEDAVEMMAKEWRRRARAGTGVVLEGILSRLGDPEIRQRFLERIRPGELIAKPRLLAHITLLDRLGMDNEAYVYMKVAMARRDIRREELESFGHLETQVDWLARMEKLRCDDRNAFGNEVIQRLAERSGKTSQSESLELFSSVLSWLELEMDAAGTDGFESWQTRVLEDLGGRINATDGKGLESLMVAPKEGVDPRAEGMRKILRVGMKGEQTAATCFELLNQFAPGLEIGEDELRASAVEILGRRADRDVTKGAGNDRRRQTTAILPSIGEDWQDRSPASFLANVLLQHPDEAPAEELALLKSVEPETAARVALLRGLMGEDAENAARVWLQDVGHEARATDLVVMLDDCQSRDFGGPGVLLLGRELLDVFPKEGFVYHANLIGWLGACHLREKGTAGLVDWHGQVAAKVIGEGNLQEEWKEIRQRDDLPDELRQLRVFFSQVAMASAMGVDTPGDAVALVRSGVFAGENEEELLGELLRCFRDEDGRMDQAALNEAGFWSESLAWWTQPRAGLELGWWEMLIANYRFKEGLIGEWETSGDPRKRLAAAWSRRDNREESIRVLETSADEIAGWPGEELVAVSRILGKEWREFAKEQAGPGVGVLLEKLEDLE